MIDGMKLGTLAARLDAADTVIFLDVPRRTCLRGVVSRRIRRRTSVCPELGTFDVGLSVEFLRWIWTFRRQQRPRILALLETARCDVVTLTTREEIRHFETSLRRRLDG